MKSSTGLKSRRVGTVSRMSSPLFPLLRRVAARTFGSTWSRGSADSAPGYITPHLWCLVRSQPRDVARSLGMSLAASVCRLATSECRSQPRYVARSLGINLT